MMKAGLALAMLLGQVQAGEAVFDRLSVDQLMRLSTLPPARITEMHCSGLATWLAHNQPEHSLALPAGAAERVAAAVATAIANDAELPEDMAREIVAGVATEPGAKIAEASAAQREVVIAKLAAPCTPLFGAAREGKPLPLHSLAQTSVVSPALASCYAQYRLAATRSEGQEAAGLNASADEAYQLALKGKSGDARSAAEAALAAEFSAAARAPQADGEAGMMRLVMCQPTIQAAAHGNGQ